MSDPLVKYSCLVPATPLPVQRVEGTRTLLKVRWAVVSDGGCPITSYHLYRNDGTSSAIIIEVDPT